MEYVPSSEHLCYVRCNFCNTVLAVGIPCKRLLDTVTVKCGHCSNLSFLSTRPPLPGQRMDHHQLGFQVILEATNLNFLPNVKAIICTKETEVDQLLEKQVFCNDYRRTQSSSSSSSTSSQQMSPKVPYVVKPPERKHRLPSAYNRFMKEEIQRIKAANPEIPHREAFSTAAKNWARYVPHPPTGSVSENNKNNERTSACAMESDDSTSKKLDST